MSGNFFRGTTAEQDTRFSNKEAKLLKSHKHFAPDLDKPVDIQKVNMEVMMKWIVKRVTELLGMEDEVLCGFIEGLLQEKGLNGKKMQLSLTGFMEKNTGRFMKELWELLMSAQANASGIPQQFLDEKAAELRAKKAEEARIADEVQKKRDAQELEREREREERQKQREERHAAEAAHREERPKVPPATHKDSPRAPNGTRTLSRSPHSKGSPPPPPPPPPPSRGRRTRSPSPASASPPPSHTTRHPPSPLRPRSHRSPPRPGRRSPPPRRRTPPRYYRSPGRSRRSPSLGGDRREGHRREGRGWRGAPPQSGTHSSRYDRSRSPLHRRLRRAPSLSPDKRAAAAATTKAQRTRDPPPPLPPPPPPRIRSPASSASGRSSPEGSPPQRGRRPLRPDSRSPPPRPPVHSPSGSQLPRAVRVRPPMAGGRVAEGADSVSGRRERVTRARSEGESGSEDGRRRRSDAAEEERKRKGDESPVDSEEQREAKRARKEEKRKRKEERQRKREEKQRRRAEREARRAAAVEGDGSAEQDGSDSGGREERRRAMEERLRLKALESMHARVARQGPE